MFSTTQNRVTFFKDTARTNTDKIVYGRVSEAIKSQNTNPDGSPIYEYESWPVRFCGGAYNKALALNDKDKIVLTQWSARNPYNKETKKGFTYLMVTDFEMAPATY